MMNERIREIEKQCWSHRVDGALVDGQLHFDTHKFAELIVRECVNVALKQKKWVENQEVFNSNDEAWNRARIQQSEHIVNKIKEHFGVEE